MITLKLFMLILMISLCDSACHHTYYSDNKFFKPNFFFHVLYGLGVSSLAMLSGVFCLNVDLDLYKSIATLNILWSIILYYMNYNVFKTSKLDEINRLDLVLYHIVSVSGSVAICYMCNSDYRYY